MCFCPNENLLPVYTPKIIFIAQACLPEMAAYGFIRRLDESLENQPHGLWKTKNKGLMGSPLAQMALHKSEVCPSACHTHSMLVMKDIQGSVQVHQSDSLAKAISSGTNRNWF